MPSGSAVLDVVDGRRGTAVRWWLRQRPEPWRARIEIVAIDMSAEFRAAIRDVLPQARIVADLWHVMTRANHMVTQVRRRGSWDLHALKVEKRSGAGAGVPGSGPAGSDAGRLRCPGPAERSDACAPTRDVPAGWLRDLHRVPG
jgi:hypothetical protein